MPAGNEALYEKSHVNSCTRRLLTLHIVKCMIYGPLSFYLRAAIIIVLRLRRVHRKGLRLPNESIR